MWGMRGGEAYWVVLWDGCGAGCCLELGGWWVDERQERDRAGVGWAWAHESEC